MCADLWAPGKQRTAWLGQFDVTQFESHRPTQHQRRRLVHEVVVLQRLGQIKQVGQTNSVTLLTGRLLSQGSDFFSLLIQQECLVVKNPAAMRFQSVARIVEFNPHANFIQGLVLADTLQHHTGAFLAESSLAREIGRAHV